LIFFEDAFTLESEVGNLERILEEHGKNSFLEHKN